MLTACDRQPDGSSDALADASSGSTGVASEAPPAPQSTGAATAIPEPATPAAAAEDSAAPAERTVMHYRPQDECAGLPGFAAFRGKLADAVARRDATALGQLAASDVTLDYGGGHGRDELIRRLSGDAAPALWSDIATILSLGCDTRDGLAVLPWFFWNVPESLDPGETMLATGPAIPMRAKPSGGAEQVAALDWEMVRLLPGFDPARRFNRVEADGGVRGYVETRALRSVLARRVIIEQRDGQWQVSAIVAGD